MGYHSNADNKFMDDYKTDIGFEEREQKRILRGFLGMSLWIAAKYTQIHHSLNILNSRVLFSLKNTT